MPTDNRPGQAVNWVIGAVLLIAVIALFLHLSSTDVEFSRYNPQWNGTSTVLETLEDRGAVMVDDPSTLAGRTGATLLVIAPGRGPTAGERAAYRDFVASGNTLLLADDFGEGNALLDAVGATIRLDQRNLSSLDREYEVPAAPLGFPVVGAPLGATWTSVVFNHPVAVTGGTPFLETSLLSWIDENGNERADATEPLGRFSLAATESVGGGRVVVIGDASLFINAMQHLRDGENEQVIRDLTGGTLLIDQHLSRTAAASGPISTILWVRNIPTTIILITALALGAIAWHFCRRKR
ncbi:DUF4350 domain-containing protein [Methanosphaerula subterraneus]|uniref:DUF4350 domain-containing protein n=1 Tax=Methanosphaerula subterraneus TaxID=3350244 RepID=UPI003F82951D